MLLVNLPNKRVVRFLFVRMTAYQVQCSEHGYSNCSGLHDSISERYETSIATTTEVHVL